MVHKQNTFIVMPIAKLLKQLLLVFAVATATAFFTSSHASAAQTASSMSDADKAMSYSYYISIQSCVQKSNLDRDIDYARVNSPSEWINGSVGGVNSRINTGYLINDGTDANGEAYCKDIITGALSFWQIDAKTFLEKLGYTLKSDGTQMNAQGSDQLNKYNDYIKSAVYGGTAPSMTPPVEYSLRQAALTSKEACAANNIGTYSSQDVAIQRQADTKTNNYFVLLSATNDAGINPYIFQRTGNENTSNNFKPGGDTGGGVSCDSLVSAMNTLAKSVAQTTADNLYNTLSNQLFSSLSGAMTADCNQYPNLALRTECQDGWRSTFNTCYATMKTNSMPPPQDTRLGEAAALYKAPSAELLSQLSACITKGTGGDAAAITAAIKGVTPPAPDNQSPLGALTVGENTKSCIIDLTGWLVCSVAQTISNAVDSLYHVIEGMMNVQPLSTDTSAGAHNGLFNAWAAMRNFANVAFVIAFMFIIYSQLTSMGVSNYGIKKLLPRLIIAAILVNVSYWICAIAVDISNIAGYSLYDLMKTTKEAVNGAVQVPLWKTVIAGVLAGQATVAGVAVSALAVAAFPEAAIWLVVPLVLGAIFAVFLAVVILIARQALIIILVFLSPLAFVAYLLPNTEKLFHMWRKSFTVMLVFFPIFSIIFGGAQLAAAIIITTTTSMLTIILAMFIQVAPLFLTPMLIKFSGGVIGKFAGMVNNKNKGLVDRASNFAKGQRDLAYKNKMSTGLGATGFRGVGRNVAARFDGFSRRRKANTAQYENQAQSQWMNSQSGIEAGDALANSESWNQIDKAKAASRVANSSEGQALAHLLKKTESQAVIDKAASETKYTTNKATLELRLKAKIANENLEGYQKEEAALLKEISSREGASKVTGVSDDLKLSAQYAARGKNLNDQRQNAAAQVLQHEQAADLINPLTGQAAYAGGVDQYGESKARAIATSVMHKQFDDAVVAEKSTMTSMNIAELQAVAADPSASEERKSAAIGLVGKNGGMGDVLKTIDNLGAEYSAAKQAGDTAKMNVVSSMQKQFFADAAQKIPVSVTGPSKGAMSTGVYEGSIANEVELSFDQGKFSGASLAGMSSHELAATAKTLTANPSKYRLADREALKESIIKYKAAAITQGKQPAPEIAKYLDDLENSLV